MRQRDDNNEMDVDLNQDPEGETGQPESTTAEGLEEDDQKKNEMRKIRQQYRKLITDTEGAECRTTSMWPCISWCRPLVTLIPLSIVHISIENRKELIDPTNDGLLANVDQANKLYQNGIVRQSLLNTPGLLWMLSVTTQ